MEVRQIITDDDFKAEIELMQKDFNKKIYDFHMKYALAKTEYKPGDIVEDHYQRVKILMVKGIINDNGIPKLVFHGLALTKKNEPKKNGCNTTIYEGNIERLIMRFQVPENKKEDEEKEN